MEAAELIDMQGRRLTISGARFDGEGWNYEAELDIASATAATDVWDHAGPGIAGYFAELAGLWRGFDGERRWNSTEGQVNLQATPAGLGTVRLEVTLARVWPPEWELRATFELGAGAHVETFANALGGVFAR